MLGEPGLNIQSKIWQSGDGFSHRADGDELVGVVHHGDEQVEQDDDVDHGEAAEHDEGPEAGELLERLMRGRVYNMFTGLPPEEDDC